MEYELSSFSEQLPAGLQSMSPSAPHWYNGYFGTDQKVWWIKNTAASCGAVGSPTWCSDYSKNKVVFNVILEAPKAVFDLGVMIVYASEKVFKNHYLKSEGTGVRWVSYASSTAGPYRIFDQLLNLESSKVTLPLYKSTAYSLDPDTSSYFTVVPLSDDMEYMNKAIEVVFQAGFYRNSNFAVSSYVSRRFTPIYRDDSYFQQPAHNPSLLPHAQQNFCSHTNNIPAEVPACLRVCSVVPNNNCCAECALIGGACEPLGANC